MNHQMTSIKSNSKITQERLGFGNQTETEMQTCVVKNVCPVKHILSQARYLQVA